MHRKKVIGIDLGTSKCCVGVVRDGKVEILENERGNKTTPSYVAFTDTERLVGEEAKDQATLNPANTVFGVKRIIGREMTDVLMDDVIHKMPYAIMKTIEEGTRIRVSYKGAEEFLLPQQVTAMLLGKMKDLAERHLNCSVEEAVISVPASFSNAQRQATKDAAAIAGLKVLALINEPTAAAIAYEANRRMTDEEDVISVPSSFSIAQRQATKDAAAIAGLKVFAFINEPTAVAIAYEANRRKTYGENVAVVDFGAGNLNVAIVTVEVGKVAVKALNGNTAIGGNDIDNVLMKYVDSKFEIIHDQKPPESPVMTERLRSSCEKLKRKLTFFPRALEKFDCFGDDITLPVTLSQEDFNATILSKVHAILKNCVRQALVTSCLNIYNINHVVLVGGSSRIPQFQKMVKDIFNKQSLDTSLNPDEAVAFGAALYAGHLARGVNLDIKTVEDIFLNNFCFSLTGDSNVQQVCEQHSSKTLPKELVFPFNKLSLFNEETLAETFELYEELSGQKNPHRLLGTFCVKDALRHPVPLNPSIIFEIDRCGIINVNVSHDEMNEVVNIFPGILGEGKLQKAIEREQQFRKDDQDERERVEAMTCLVDLSFRLISAMGESKAKDLFPEIVKQISDKAKENIQWLDVTDTVPKADYVERHNELEKLENDLKLKIKPYDEEENDCLAAEKG